MIYPISQGNREPYPFAASLEAVREIHERLGADRLVWGSDIPMVERYCTFSQSVKYLTDYADFLPEGELRKILGTNLEEIFNRK